MTTSSLDLYRRDLRGVSVLDAEVERDLARRWAGGDRAAGERLVEACLPFVIAIAHEYRRWGVPLEDLVQQGNLGLLRAASKFDPDRGCRLATYAATWIRGEVREYCVRSYRIVRIGSTHTERTAVRRYRDGSATSPEDLAARSGMPVARCRALWPLLTHRDAAYDVDVSASESASPEEALARREERRAVRAGIERALARLDRRERRIVEARMLAEDPCTLESLAGEMGISRERVRQLESRARDVLRTALAPAIAA